MQRRATTAYRLPVPLGTPPLLNVWRLEPVKLPRARVTLPVFVNRDQDTGSLYLSGRTTATMGMKPGE